MINDTWIRYFKAVCWKEIRELFYTMKSTIIIMLLSMNVLQYMTAAKIINTNTISLNIKQQQLGALTMYIPIMIILFFGNAVSSKIIDKERKNKTIHVLLASGISKTSIWYGKIVVTIICSIILTLVAVFMHIIFIGIYCNIWISFSFHTIINTFIAMPLLAIGIITLISTCYWYFKNSSIFSALFTMISYLGIWQIALFLYDKYPNNLVIMLSVLIGVILTISSFIIIKNISKERITGI